MKKSFNSETLIIPGFLLIILGFITLLALYPSKTENVNDKNFVGIDAVGAKHGAGVKSTIKYH